MSTDDRDRRAPTASRRRRAVDVEAVREAALEFVDGLTDAFGFDGDVEAVVDGTEIEVARRRERRSAC